MNVKGNFKNALSFSIKHQDLFEIPQREFMSSPTNRQ